MDITAILMNAQKVNFVPPVTLKSVGASARRLDVEFDDKWPDSVRIGWIQENSIRADAQTSAFLIAQERGR